MDDRVLFTPDAPGLHVLAVDPSPLADLIFGWRRTHPDWAILRVRGHKSMDDAHFFDEASAALQFPYYFGENWNAFWECLTDLSWLLRPSFLIVVDRADLLLSHSDKGFATLMQIVGPANEHWRNQRGQFGSEFRPVSFQVLLACSSGALPALASRIAKTGAPFLQL
jgi:RNAse (barnase) inhibitor barstar